MSALLWLIKRALEIPQSTHWYVAPTYKQGKRAAWDKLLNICPVGIRAAKPHGSELSVTLINGSKIFVVGGDDPDSLRGPSLHSVVLDEYGTMRQTAWTQAIRPMLSATNGHALFIGTPNALRGPHLEQLWMEVTAGQKPGWLGSFQTTLQAAYITQEEIDDARASLRDWEFRQEFEGEFVELAGRIWPEFVDELYEDNDEGCLTPSPEGARQIPAPKGWDVVCGLDWGHVHPFAAIWIAVGPSQQIQVVAEYVDKGHRMAERANALTEISKMYGGVDNVRFVGDPSRAKEMAQEWASEGIHIEGAVNDVERGIERVGRLLAHGYLYVPSCCILLRQGMLHYSYDPRSTRVRVLKENDDECDALRYACMAVPPPALLSRPEERDVDRVPYWEDDPVFVENWDENSWELQWDV